MNTRIDCPTCDRMGRVTVILPNGNLTTATCSTCSGEGVMFEHFDLGCEYCIAAKAGAQPIKPMFEWNATEVTLSA